MSITLRVSQEELAAIKKAADALWPNTPASFSLSAKVRELIRQRVEQILKHQPCPPSNPL